MSEPLDLDAIEQGATDADLHSLRNWLTSDATVERVARALNNAGWTCDGGTHEPGLYDDCAECRQWCDEGARTALAAALAPEKETT